MPDDAGLPPVEDLEGLFSEGKDAEAIAEALDISVQRVRSALCTEDRLEQLYHEEGLSQREIGERLGVTQPLISRWMKQRGIETRDSPLWTEEEEAVLEDNYQEISREELESSLPERSWNAIKEKAQELGVARSMEEHRHSQEVRERLQSNAQAAMIDIDFRNTDILSYILGVVDGDGFHDGTGTVGLENTSEAFVEKFSSALSDIGMNPGRGRRRGNRETVWASSKQLVEWIMDKGYEDKRMWLDNKGDGWRYIEGRYESDGNIHPSGSPRICSYDNRAKEFIQNLLSSRGVTASIQQNNVWISRSSADTFFDNIDPVLRKPDQR